MGVILSNYINLLVTLSFISFPSWIHCSMIYIVHSVDSVVAHVFCIVLQLYLESLNVYCQLKFWIKWEQILLWGSVFDIHCSSSGVISDYIASQYGGDIVRFRMWCEWKWCFLQKTREMLLVFSTVLCI